MKLKHHRFLTLFGVLMLLSFGCQESTQRLPEEIENEINRRVQEKLNPGISMALLMPNGETQFFNFGHISLDSSTKVNNTTIYEIGSVTKTFTALLTKLHLQKELSQPIAQHFTEINNAHLQNVYPKDLRNHSAGLPRLSNQFAPEDWSDPFYGYSDSLLYEELAQLSPDATPQWAYSNFGYGVLGKVIEKSTNQSFEQVMGNLLNRIGMEHSYLSHETVKEETMASPTNIGTENSYWHFTGPSRYAGGLLTCTKDLIKYLDHQVDNNPLFQQETLTDLISTGIDDLGEDQLFYKDGWFVLKPDSLTEILLHNGGTGGFTSFVAYNKSTDTGVALLSNSVNLTDDIGLQLIYPEFELNFPKRTIAYELADRIDHGNIDSLVQWNEKWKQEGLEDDIYHIYWLERYHFGQANWQVSNQLSDIMLKALPDDWEAWDIKGQNLEKLKQYEASVDAYQKAYELNPELELLKEKIKRCESSME